METMIDELQGKVIRPGDAEYEHARRVWNAAIDRRPALIVRARTAADVSRAVRWARAQEMPLAVRGGGHSPAGHGVVDDGLVIDLRPMRRLAIDPERHIASAGGGLTWGDYNHGAGQHGLATPAGDVAAVGVAGLALGGGFGLLSRKHGMTVDSLLGVDLVTAGGHLVTADAETHPELFWAVRGGGGNFGISIELRFRLHPLDTVMGGAIVYPATSRILRAYTDTAMAAPDELSTLAFVMQAPPFDFLPTEQHGRHVLSILACDTGDADTAHDRLNAFRSLAGTAPLADTTGPIPYTALTDFTAQAALSRPHAVRSGFLREISDETLEAMLEWCARPTSPFGMAMLRVLGGAIERVPNDATAFAHRDKIAFLNLQNAWDEPADADRHVAWVEAFWQAVAPATDGAYANYLGDEGADRVGAAYPPPTFERLAAIKRRYDPTNVFQSNANILPASSGP